MLCHLFPSLSPFNVWDLPWHVWRGFAQAVDRYAREMKEASQK